MALCIDVALGLLFSPVTSARRIRVVGAPEETREAIRRDLVRLQGRPAMQVNRRLVESKVADLDPVRSATFHLNVFGSGTLTVRPKLAVARVVGLSDGYLSKQGEVFLSKTAVAEGLPSLVLPAAAGSPSTTLAAGWESERAAWLCSKLPELGEKWKWKVLVDARGAYVLRPEKGALVRLGSSRGFEEKIDWLRKALQLRPDVFFSSKEVNLFSVGNPSYLP